MKQCDQCDDPAVVRITMATLEGTVLDTVYLCPACLHSFEEATSMASGLQQKRDD